MFAAKAGGPLSSSAVQYALIGLGAYAILPPGSTVISVMDSFVSVAKQLSNTGGGGGGGGRRGDQPIVINVPSSSSPHGGHGSGIVAATTRTLLLQASLAAAFCWLGYGLVTNLLPQSFQEMLPVSKKLFEAAVQSLARGLIGVKETLGEAIGVVDAKVGALQDRQNETYDKVVDIETELSTIKIDVSLVHETVKRCETELARAARRQSYTARGVRLLLSCVGALMPASAQRAGELSKFTKAGVEGEERGEEEVSAAEVVEEMRQKKGGGGEAPKKQYLRAISSPSSSFSSPAPSESRSRPSSNGTETVDAHPENVHSPPSPPLSPQRLSAPKSPMTPQQVALGESQKNLDEVRALLAGVGGGTNLISPVKGC